MDYKKQYKLIKECKKGRRKAQNELFRYYKRIVLQIAYRYSSSKNDAEDLFQDCFVQIFKSLVRKGIEIENLDAWVYRICINTCIKKYKVLKYDELALHEDDFLTDDHIEIIDGLSTQKLIEIINRLPDGYRVIFNLYFIDGYSHKEIAEAIGISISTSRSQLTRARKMLKYELQKLGIYGYEAS